ncbi:MAG: UDP-N-acetylglucosamine 2-epimerase (hydrolyzing) [Flavobacteriales bacterium]|nr:UDP-N-acetylglucosamine 2-epimerase (hydrolyzing) [Flavobacteriales bacterium]
MKIALISCGRSDFSIYLPLIKRLKKDSFFNLEIIVFGTHVSSFFGNTFKLFEKEGFKVAHKIESLVLGDSAESIASAMGLTMIKFASLWNSNSYDLIIVLGDRYEMFSAISASVPFNIPVAHLHGGETTLGAIDDKFRHCLSSLSDIHFTSTEGHKSRVTEIIGTSRHVYNVGAPALDNLSEIDLYTISEFKNIFNIDLSIPTILCTFHPETVLLEKNHEYTLELISALESVENFQIVITMPNADTMGSHVRSLLQDFIRKNENICGVENFGTRGYYSCMNYSSFLLGNTSSGIIEAASFGKYVINLGDRQKGRTQGDNIVNVEIKAAKILEAIEALHLKPELDRKNIYGNGTASEKIVDYLKDYHLQRNSN